MIRVEILWLFSLFSLAYGDGRVGVLPVMNVTGLIYGGAGVNISLPKQYDWRKSYPKCVKNVYDSGPCEASWAISVASSASDRACINDLPAFSPSRVLTCCPSCGSGCYGGYPWEALKHLMTKGTSTPACQPMQSLETDHVRAVVPPCRQRICNNRSLKFKQINIKGRYLVRNIDNEIFTNGPVISYIDLYQEFLNYTGGIFEKPKSPPIGKVSVKLLGWGEENGAMYWIGEHCWGSKWGENGYFRITRNTTNGFVERTVMAPSLLKVTSNNKS